MSTKAPCCPRCGYDLSGRLAADREATPDSCPVHGLCSECGLEFWWGDIFDPYRFAVPGFIEHAQSGLLFAAWRTFALALLPSRFWRRVRIEMEPRRSRLLLWFFLTGGLVCLIGSVAASIAVLQYPSPRFYTRSDAPLLNVWFFGVVDFDWVPASLTTRTVFSLAKAPAAVSAVFVASIAMPLMLLFLPDTRRLSKVKLAHVLRAFTYSLAWLVIVLVLRAVWQSVECFEDLNFLRVATTAPLSARAPNWPMYAGQSVHRYWFPWLALLLAWLGWWWWSALRDGWRIAEYQRVWWAMALPTLLAVVLAVVCSKDGLGMFM